MNQKSGFGGANNDINYSIKDSIDYKVSITGKLEGGIVEKDDAKIVMH